MFFNLCEFVYKYKEGFQIMCFVPCDVDITHNAVQYC